MADNYDAMGLDMLFTIINNKGDDEAENMMYMVAYGPGAEEVLQDVYGNDDAAGFFVFKENLSRKAESFRPSPRLFSRRLKRLPDRSRL